MVDLRKRIRQRGEALSSGTTSDVGAKADTIHLALKTGGSGSLAATADTASSQAADVEVQRVAVSPPVAMPAAPAPKGPIAMDLCKPPGASGGARPLQNCQAYQTETVVLNASELTPPKF